MSLSDNRAGSSLRDTLALTCHFIVSLRCTPHGHKSYYGLNYHCVLGSVPSALFCVLLNSHNKLFTFLDKETEVKYQLQFKGSV